MLKDNGSSRYYVYHGTTAICLIIYTQTRGEHHLIAHKLPDKYNIDYIICTDFGKQVAFVECKGIRLTTIGD